MAIVIYYTPSSQCTINKDYSSLSMNNLCVFIFRIYVREIILNNLVCYKIPSSHKIIHKCTQIDELRISGNYIYLHQVSVSMYSN